MKTLLVIVLSAALVGLTIFHIRETSSYNRKIKEVTEKDEEYLSFSNCGTPYAKGKSPWLARIKLDFVRTDYKMKRQHCYGLVISNVSILTSALCVFDAGEAHHILVTFSHNFYAEAISPAEYKIHEKYEPNKDLNYNIALLNFDHNILGQGIWPICLWNKRIEDFGELITENNGIATLIGINNTNGIRLETGEGKLNIAQPRECMQEMSRDYQDFLDFGRICAKNLDFSSIKLEGCGTPLQFKIGERWFLRGLYDKKFVRLPKARVLITFTDVARYLDFIYSSAKMLTRNPMDYYQDNLEETQTNSVFSYRTCGIKPGISNYLIANGESTKIREYPWQTSLYYLDHVDDDDVEILTFQCGGSLISKNFVLTAAHCVLNTTNANKYYPLQQQFLRVIFGETSKIMERTLEQNIFEVENVIYHSRFNRNNPGYDIALIELKGEVIFTETVSPVCIWTTSAEKKKIIGRNATVTGLGLLKDHLEANNLQTTTLPILEDEKCRGIIDTSESNMICAGYVNGSTAVCNGDSGGSLLLMEYGRVYARGIVSQGKSHPENSHLCEYSYPALFTDVAMHAKWINDNTDLAFAYYSTLHYNTMKQALAKKKSTGEFMDFIKVLFP